MGLLNLARMTVSGSPGTGPVTLLAAVLGYLTFDEAGAVDGRVYTYSIRENDKRELCRGAYNASTLSLARGTLISTNATHTNPETFSSAAIVSVVAAAEDFPDDIWGSDPLTQLKGATPANIAEVETATKALRATIRAADLGGGIDNAFSYNRHMVSFIIPLSTTTTAVLDVVQLAAFWGFTGIALLNKLSVSLGTTAISGARAGNAVVRLQEMFPMVTVGSTIWIPPQNVSAPNANYNSLKQNQVPPCINIGGNAAGNSGGYTTMAGNRNLNMPLGIAIGKCTSAIENNIPPMWLFDAMGTGKYTPYVMSTFTGFCVSMSLPAAVTSQTVNMAVTMQWDELIADGGDRT